ncbi:zinc finger protein 135 [Brienomyrus brachyistius]|uniref:zinc finger protein 135 n=1 Tax=Brienomyrus brachyistius TaxID=42636 RepID=UPI0020B39801|nr:zinc finger protein 135 [Brienomyrus brachyistius]XP_048835961.1 zinc finger protein 135 [Brienomyrus brachyistius]XP_048835962.1 zinc finger protein 135 [Brienomyrus brachyistius]
MDAVPCRMSTQDSIVDTRQGSECPLLARVSTHGVQQEGELNRKAQPAGSVIRCEECGQGFANIPGLLRHQQRDHDIHKPYHCPTCGQAFNLLSSLRLHCRTHTALTYKTGVSYPTSSPRAGLQKHGVLPNAWERLLSGHQRHLQDREPYACAPCGKAFSHKPALLQHQQAGCHVPGSVSCPPVPSLSTLPTPPQAPLVTPTALPDVSHATQSSVLSGSCSPPLVIPVTSQAPPISPQAPEHSTRSPPVASTPPTPARLYLCSLCCRKFRSQVGLASHQRLSHPAEWKQALDTYWGQGGKKFPCSLCDKVFCHSPSLSQHKLRCHGQTGRREKGETGGANPHPKGRVFPCRSCDMVFSQTSSLQLHRKEQHRRPVRTRDRGRASTSHPKRRRRKAGFYPCLYCSKVFGHHLTRQAHVRTLHPQPHFHLERRSHEPQKSQEATGQEVQGRKYRCPRCGQAYRNHSRLIRHRCQYVKVLQRAARRQEAGCRKGEHSKRPEGNVEEGSGSDKEDNKVFPCPSCEEVFSQLLFLREHELMHQPVEETKACGVCRCDVGAPWSGKSHGAGARVYHCEPCRRTFRTLRVFLEHCQIHLGPQNGVSGVE